jgi:hypothetical protein
MDPILRMLLDRLPETIIYRQQELSLKLTKSEGVWWGSYGGLFAPKIFEEIGDENFQEMLKKLYECLKKYNLLSA